MRSRAPSGEVTAALYVEDVLLVDRCLTGEPAATRELFRRHRNRVHASLFRVLGSNRDMDDLLQEAFLQVFQSLRVSLPVAERAPRADRSARRRGAGGADLARLRAGGAAAAGARWRGAAV